MEKKRYEEMELEVVRFDAEDVVTASGESCDYFNPGADCTGYTDAAGNYYEYYCFAV